MDDGGGSASGLLPVLFVHGNGGNHTQWSAQLEHLRSAGRRAAALDLRGMGGSDIAYDGDYSIDGFASDVAAAADALKLDRFVLVGHSFGGAVVAAYAGKHPDRLAGLVFADVAGDMRGTPQAQIETLMRGLQPPTYEEFTRRWFGAILAKGTDATKAAVMKSLRATPREVFVAATTGLYSFDQGAALAPYRGPRLHIASFLVGNAQAIDKALRGHAGPDDPGREPLADAGPARGIQPDPGRVPGRPEVQRRTGSRASRYSRTSDTARTFRVSALEEAGGRSS